MTPEEMLDLPLGAVFQDRFGDVWMLDTIYQRVAYLISPETKGQTAQYVDNKFGPLTLKWLPLPKSEYPVE